MSNDKHWLQGDLVVYTGEKNRGEIGGAPGEICAPVVNQPGTYVVAFGKDDYVLSGTLLAPFQGNIRSGEERHNKKSGGGKDSPGKKDRSGPTVERRRTKPSDDDVED